MEIKLTINDKKINMTAEEIKHATIAQLHERRRELFKKLNKNITDAELDELNLIIDELFSK